MRLVGATDGYPPAVLIEGIAKGVMGGLLALLLTYAATHADRPVPDSDGVLRRASDSARTALRGDDRVGRQLAFVSERHFTSGVVFRC